MEELPKHAVAEAIVVQINGSRVQIDRNIIFSGQSLCQLIPVWALVSIYPCKEQPVIADQASLRSPRLSFSCRMVEAAAGCCIFSIAVSDCSREKCAMSLSACCSLLIKALSENSQRAGSNESCIVRQKAQNL